MPSILTRNYVANPLGIADFLDDLRTAALAFGWTVDEYQSNVAWGYSGGYTWIAGTENFLQLSSGGWGGNQGMVFRFRTDASGYLYFKAIDPNYPSYSAVSTHPVFQNAWAPDSTSTFTNSRHHLPTGSYPGNYFFGNDKFIACHMQVYTSVVFCFAFGTIDLFTPYHNETDNLIFMWSGITSSSYTYDYVLTNQNYWQLWTAWNPGSSTQAVVWWDGAKRYSNEAVCSTQPKRDEVFSQIAGYYTKYGKCLTYNAFSGRTMALSPTFFVKNNTSGLWEPVGHYPCAVVNFQNLDIDEEITYGMETYRVMPTLFNSYPYGVAYRTA